MKWSWKLGKFAGIDVYIHATFSLLIGYIAIISWIQDRSLISVASGVAFILALFSAVLLHEYGHALTARRFGIPTSDITLLPIGGVARLERMPDDPKQELWVSLAGPAVNVIIAAVMFVWLMVSSGFDIFQIISASDSIFVRFLTVNLFLVGFNMIPAFPMDGGRVFRALLAMRIDYLRATQVAAMLGRSLAVLFAIIGFFGNPFLIFIAIFVWTGAAQEASMVRMKSSIEGITVNRVMETDFHILSPYNQLSQAVLLSRSTSQKDFPVVDNGQLIGMLTRQNLIDGLKTRGQSALVGDVMTEQLSDVDAFDKLSEAFERITSCGCNVLPVTQSGDLVGLLTTDGIRRFISLHSAVRQAGANI